MLKCRIKTICLLVNWYFEPRQPQRITSRLKTMFNVSPVYSEHKSSNHEFSKKDKISPDTSQNKAYAKVIHKFYEELVPLVLPLLKKHLRLGHSGIADHSVDLLIPDFKKL